MRLSGSYRHGNLALPWTHTGRHTHQGLSVVSNLKTLKYPNNMLNKQAHSQSYSLILMKKKKSPKNRYHKSSKQTHPHLYRNQQSLQNSSNNISNRLRKKSKIAFCKFYSTVIRLRKLILCGILQRINWVNSIIERVSSIFILCFYSQWINHSTMIPGITWKS